MENETPKVIRRSDMGLAISGTRITLYDVMDYLRAGRSRDEILHWLSLTEAELGAALAYIEAHREEVEAEYREVLRQAEERRAYYDALLREHLAKRPPTPSSPEHMALRARIAEARAGSEAALERDRAQRGRSSRAVPPAHDYTVG